VNIILLCLGKVSPQTQTQLTNLSQDTHGGVEELWLGNGVDHTLQHGQDSMEAEQVQLLGDIQGLQPV